MSTSQSSSLSRVRFIHTSSPTITQHITRKAMTATGMMVPRMAASGTSLVSRVITISQ
jgi:hypothetical protein